MDGRALRHGHARLREHPGFLQDPQVRPGERQAPHSRLAGRPPQVPPPRPSGQGGAGGHLRRGHLGPPRGGPGGRRRPGQEALGHVRRALRHHRSLHRRPGNVREGEPGHPGHRHQHQGPLLPDGQGGGGRSEGNLRGQAHDLHPEGGRRHGQRLRQGRRSRWWAAPPPSRTPPSKRPRS